MNTGDENSCWSMIGLTRAPMTADLTVAESATAQ
jgi:hypothetical protein